MIARLRGKPVARTADGLLIDVGGVGYLVAATTGALRKAVGAAEVSIDTYLHVREDVLQLYGFSDASERELFLQLLSVKGVGPKVALAILSSATTADLRRAIAREDAARFHAIPGIGKKTAERIVLELKEKLGSVVEAVPRTGGDLLVRDALVELGWTVSDAEQALARVDSDLTVEEQVRRVLKEAA